MIEIIKGDLLEAKEKYIAHQLNATTNQAGGLAHFLFKKFLHADVYSSRSFPHKVSSHDAPGNIIIKGNGEDQRFVIGMIGQLYPGSPKYPDSMIDGLGVREGNFKRCLLAISNISKLESIAFPFLIGCGLAGGNWGKYKEMLNDFAVSVKRKQNARVVVYNNTR